MKNKYWGILMLLVLATVIAFSSCGKDDDDSAGGENVPSDLIGTWYYDNGQWSRSLTFNKNGTFSLTKSSKNGSMGGHTGNFKVKGTTITCTGPYWTVYADGSVDEDDNYTATYTYSNGQLNDGDYRKH